MNEHLKAIRIQLCGGWVHKDNSHFVMALFWRGDQSQYYCDLTFSAQTGEAIKCITEYLKLCGSPRRKAILQNSAELRKELLLILP